MTLETAANIVNAKKINFFDQLTQISEYLKALCNHSHLNISEEVNVCVQKLKNREDNVNLNSAQNCSSL